MRHPELLLHHEDGGESVLSVVGKGDKPRTIPVPPEAVDVVHTYLAERDARFGDRTRGGSCC